MRLCQSFAGDIQAVVARGFGFRALRGGLRNTKSIDRDDRCLSLKEAKSPTSGTTAE